MKKPFYVELKIGAVVMADNEEDARTVALSNAREINRDGELEFDSAQSIKSLEHLQMIDSGWNGNCIPYGGDGNTRMIDLLNETSPALDVHTRDMFYTEPPRG